MTSEDERPTPRRINVAVTPPMLAAIDLVIDHEDVTLTEAVRRLVTLGGYMYRTVHVDGGELHVVREETTMRVEVL